MPTDEPTDELRTHSASMDIVATADEIYDLVSDVTRTGEWSPICTWCRWDEGDGPQVGARFTGHNEVPGRTWETKCEVVEATPGEQFAWIVNGGLVRWGYTLESIATGTRVTESWEFRPEGLAFFRDKYGDEADAEIEIRTTAAREGIPVTLEAIRIAAERR